jgi:hypothetical protein
MQNSTVTRGAQWLIRGLGTGLLMVAIAACDQARTPEAPLTETPESPATEPMTGRAAYSEIPLPEASLLVGDDPQQIALNAFGSAEPMEGNFEEEVVLVEQTATQAVVNLTQTSLPDDSVEGMRYWLEFVPEGNQWQMVWAGRQARCQPNRGSQEWTTELCQ